MASTSICIYKEAEDKNTFCFLIESKDFHPSYGVPGENESGERLLDMCVEQELVIGNSFF